MGNSVPMTTSDALAPLVEVCICFIVLNTFFIVLRYFARLWVKPIPLGLDDAMLFLAYVNNIGLCAVSITMVHIFTRGNPPADVPMPRSKLEAKTKLEPILKCIYAIAQLNVAACALPKLSLLFLYLRVFVAKAFRIATLTTGAVVIAVSISCCLADVFACAPIHHFWDRLTPGTCFDVDRFYRWVNGINVLLDIVITVLPLYPLWQLQAPISRKIGLSIVFLITGIGFITSVLRWVAFLRHTAQVPSARTTNILTIWLVVEASIYLIACCLAGCGPLFAASKKIMSKSKTFASSERKNILANSDHGEKNMADFSRLQSREGGSREFDTRSDAV